MPYHIYIIYSAIADRFYVGHTSDLANRLFRHNNSGSKSTKKVNDWKLVYTEPFGDKSSAVSRELQIKKKKSRKYIEWLISSVGQNVLNISIRAILNPFCIISPKNGFINTKSFIFMLHHIYMAFYFLLTSLDHSNKQFYLVRHSKISQVHLKRCTLFKLLMNIYVVRNGA